MRMPDSPEVTPRVLVVGGGAIGGVTAAHLARSGHDVVVLDTSSEHVSLMSRRGLQFDEPTGTSTVRVPAVESADDLNGQFDFALITLKAPYLRSALTPLMEAGRIDTYVSLGNGLVQNVIGDVVGRDRFVVGITEWGATNLGPGHLAQTTVAPFVIGEVDGRSTPRLAILGGVLSAVAEVVTSDHVLGQVWSKLLLNSTFSGLGAVTGGLYEDIASDPVARAVAYRLWTEAYDVATALDLDLAEIVGVAPDGLVVRSTGDSARAGAALAILMRRLGKTKASMLQDLERGAITEVDVINGGVSATARSLGIASPLNDRVVEIVHACESGRLRPGAEALAALSDV